MADEGKDSPDEQVELNPSVDHAPSPKPIPSAADGDTDKLKTFRAAVRSVQVAQHLHDGSLLNDSDPVDYLHQMPEFQVTSSGETLLEAEDSHYTSVRPPEPKPERYSSREERTKAIKESMEKLRVEHYTFFGPDYTYRNVLGFAVCYGVIIMLRTALSFYMFSTSDLLRRRFFLTPSSINFVQGMQKVGFICTLIFVAYYGNKLHKPLAILAGSILTAIGGILCTLPHFLTCSVFDSSPTESTTQLYFGMCGSWTSEDWWLNSTCMDQVSRIGPNDPDPAFQILSVGELLVGVGSAIMATLGFVYMDEAGRKDMMPLTIGITLCMNGFGEILGVLLHRAVGINQGGVLIIDGVRVGSWWVGFLVLSLLLFLSSFSMLIYPRFIKEPRWLLLRKLKHKRYQEKKAAYEKELRRRVRARKRARERRKRLRKDSRAVTTSTPVNLFQAQPKKTEKNENAKKRKQSNKNNANSTQGGGKTSDENEDTSTGKPSPSMEEKQAPGSSHRMGHSKRKGKHNLYTKKERRASKDRKADTKPNELKSPNKTSKTVEEKKKDASKKAENHSTEQETTENEQRSSTSLKGSRKVLAESKLRESKQDVSEKPAETESSPDLDAIQEEEEAGNKEKVARREDEKESDEKRKEPELPVQASLSAQSQADTKEALNDVAEIEQYRKEKKQKKRQRLGRKFKDLPRNLWYLLTHVVFVIPTLGCALALYLQAGFYPVVPHYLHIHFLYTVEEAAEIAGVIFGLSQAAGPLVAGLVIWKFRIKLHTQYMIVIGLMVATCVGIAILFPLGCDQKFFKSEKNSTSNTNPLTGCLSRCECLSAEPYDVCTSGHELFPSPCHAGCENVEKVDNGTIIFSNCFCMPGMEYTVSTSWCSKHCPAKGAFGFLLFVAILAQSACHVTAVLTFLRALPEKMRSLSLGFALWLAYLASYVPGVAVYDGLANRACSQWLANDQDEQTCWRYSRDKHRYSVNATSLVTQALACVVVIIITAMKIMKKESDKEESPISSQGGDLGYINRSFDNLDNMEEKEPESQPGVVQDLNVI